MRAPADWDGIGLAGKAPTNLVGNAGFIEPFAGNPLAAFGGVDAAHDCGKLKYVRIEFANKSLQVGGCGSATELDFVQAHKGADDGVQFVGGTANLKHMVITQPGDDGIDWESGYQGKIQFLVIQQPAGNGFEGDNNNPDFEAMPRSSPTIWNATLWGNGADPAVAAPSTGLFLRRGTAGVTNNGVVAKFPDLVIDVNGASTAAQATAGALHVKTSILWDSPVGAGATFAAEAVDNDGGFDEVVFFTDAAVGNKLENPLLTDAANLTAPNFTPTAGSPALTGAGTPPNDGFFDVTATFMGGIGATDWTTGWTAYPEN